MFSVQGLGLGSEFLSHHHDKSNEGTVHPAGERIAAGVQQLVSDTSQEAELQLVLSSLSPFYSA